MLHRPRVMRLALERRGRERALREVDIAIGLVARGEARAIRLSGLPSVERIAAEAAARVAAAGLAFALVRTAGGSGVLVIGPFVGGVA